tara:strand:- start:247 stop:585 length:339 start_codon:yes stop_codon:yes gene_type:complete
MIKETVLEVSCFFVCLKSSESADSSSTSARWKVLPMSVNFTNATSAVNTDMRGYHDNDVSILREVTVKSSPSSFTCERETGQTSEWEHFTPSVLEERGYIFKWVIVIDLIWA